MIVSALVKRYEDLQDVPYGWQKRDVSYALEIDKNGNLLGVATLEMVDGKKRTKRNFELPTEPPGRTSGIKAAFLCDNGGYMLGLDEKRGKEKFEAARTHHKEILANINTASANAIIAYFNNGIPKGITEFIDIDTASKATFIFQVNGKFVDVNDSAICGAWNDFYCKDIEDTELTRCLISGKLAPPAKVHSTVALRGGHTSGSYLISANADSFTSYGKTTKERAADIGRYSAFAYTTALNALLKDENHRRFIGVDTLVFWAEKGGTAEESFFCDLLEPPKADEDGELMNVLDKIAKGDMVNDFKSERKFYLLCLSPNSARISVRFFHVGDFGDLIHKIKEHYARLEIIGDNKTPFNYLPLWLILSETTIKKKSGDANPLLGGQFLRSILVGTKYPFMLYHAMIMRIRASDEINKTKAAVVKAVLINNFNEREVTTVALNEKTDNKPYVLGRLFAVMERLQEKANGSATIRGRYFASACSNPGNVFPTLLSLSMHHSEKLDNAIFFEKLKTELLWKLDDDTPFPAVFNIDDQGKFILGYYHQTQWFFTKKEKEEGKANEQ